MRRWRLRSVCASLARTRGDTWSASETKRTLRIGALIASVLGASQPAFAQRAEDNAVTAASDAFGQSVGNERIGLYGQDDVRGFSPIEAGNARLEGLYFVTADNPIALVADSNSVRVGIAAQNYLFPAPTGIVDYTLNKALGNTSASLSLDRGQFGSLYGQLDVRLRLGADTGLLASLAQRFQERHEGGNFRHTIGSAALSWRPYDGALVVPFAGVHIQRDDEAVPALFPDGSARPPQIRRGVMLGQSWTDRAYNNRLYGIIARLPLNAWRMDIGLFRAERDYLRNFSDSFLNLQADGSTANRVIVADFNNRDAIWSGETRASYAFATGALSHSLSVSLRGRRTVRRFGGGQRILLGASTILTLDERPEPVFAMLPDDNDSVQQTTLGASYLVSQPGRFSINAAVSRARYRKRVDFASASRPDLTFASDPWLGNISASAFLTKRLVAYGGYVRGFEDPPLAPEIAVNRGDAPPALQTRQIEFGLRYSLQPGLNLVAGVFEIQKPYFNLDAARNFRDLGTIRNRGLELSIAGVVLPGLSVIGGSVLLDPRITGAAARSGLVGSRPVGSVQRRTVFNIDWRLSQGRSPLSLDIAFESFSSRVGNVANTLSAPPRDALSVGLRYRFKVARVPALLRLQVYNIFDSYGWNVQPSGAWSYARPRLFMSEFQLDF